MPTNDASSDLPNHINTNTLQQSLRGPVSASSNQNIKHLRGLQVPTISLNGVPLSKSSASASGGPLSNRKKVRLDPGCSPLDWSRLNSSGQNLRGIHPSDFPVRVTKDLLIQHQQQDDCWTVLNGKVYNITPYVRFHPGGVDEIMKCAGKDGTTLFNKYHAWVNYERMLENCLVGLYTV